MSKEAIETTPAKEPLTEGEQLIAKGLEDREKGAATAKPETPPKPTAEMPGEVTPAAGKPGVETLEEKFDKLLKSNQALAARLEATVKGENSREAQRAGEDARDQFMRDFMPDFDRNLMRKVLPATTDQAKLREASNLVVKAFKDVMDKMVQKKQLVYLNLGGDQGGHPPVARRTFGSATEAIAAGLEERGRR